MKSLLRSTLKFSGLSVAFVALLFGIASETLALSQKEIVKKLKIIPVFTLADQNGSPLVLTKNEQEVTNVFMSKQDAENFLKKLKENKPDLAKKVEIMPQSLGEVYKVVKDNKSENLNFAFVPRKEEVESAVSLLKEQGNKPDQFAGVPLYTASRGDNQGYLTIEQNNQQAIPFFFDKEQLQGMLDQFKQKNPEKAKSVEIQVLTLESMLQTMQENQNKDLQKVQFIPSKESLQFLQSIQQKQQNSQ